MEITPEMQAEIDAQVAAKVGEARQGFETEKEKIVSNAQTLLDEKKKLEQKFAGIDVDKYKEMSKALEDKEARELFEEGKLDSLIEQRAATKVAEVESKLEEAINELTAAKTANGEIQSNYDGYRIRDAIVREATAAKVEASAIEDVVLRAKGKFSIGQDGTVIALDADGNIVKEGGKPLTPKLFIEGLKKDAPHLWPASSGAHLRGSGEDGTAFGKGSPIQEAAAAGNMKDFRAARKAAKKA